VESEYRALYLRFTGQKNRGSVRHALREAVKWGEGRGEDVGSRNEKKSGWVLADVDKWSSPSSTFLKNSKTAI
jgi:hypothetical protein